MSGDARRILVIRLGALGDVSNSFPAFAAIHAHHGGDHVTLLTTQAFAALLTAAPWFDAVRLDPRPRWFDLRGLWHLRRRLTGFDFVYDLQTSQRSGRYFLLAGRPRWSGIARGCSHPDRNPARGALPTVARQRAQLAAAGVPPCPPDLAWVAGHAPPVMPPFALLVPGTSSAHGGAKQWPAARFAAVATALLHRGVTPVIVGGAADRTAAAAILAACPQAHDLTGRTTLLALADLARGACVAIGGDTGPIHLAGIMGCPTIALFSRFSDPANATPEGPCTLLRATHLADLPAEDVVAALPRP